MMSNSLSSVLFSAPVTRVQLQYNRRAGPLDQFLQPGCVPLGCAAPPSTMNAAALLWLTVKRLLSVMFQIRFLTSDSRLHFFRAPEIYLGQPITEAVDVWGVGCVLACLFTSFSWSTASIKTYTCSTTQTVNLMCSTVSLSNSAVFILCADEVLGGDSGSATPGAAGFWGLHLMLLHPGAGC